MRPGMAACPYVGPPVRMKRLDQGKRWLSRSAQAAAQPVRPSTPASSRGPTWRRGRRCWH